MIFNNINRYLISKNVFLFLFFIAFNNVFGYLQKKSSKKNILQFNLAYLIYVSEKAANKK